MANGERNDPFRGYNFRLEIDGTSDVVTAFREASGLVFTIDPIEYREGNSPDNHPLKLTGLRKYSNIMLKRGITQNQELWIWYLNTVTGPTDRRSGAVVLMDEEHGDVVRWNFRGGWICKWEGPSMNATQNEVAIESIEICVEHVALV